MVVATLGCGFVRTGAIAGALLFILVPSAARAQLNPGDIERLKDAAARQGALLAQRIAGTTGFEGCDLQFVHTHRDTEARKGELVKYAGSFRASYASGKAPKLHLQVRGSDLFVASEGRVSETPFVPAAVTLSLGNVMFKSSPPAKDAVCEKGAVCAVVDFPNFESIMAIGQAVIGETLSMHVTPAKGTKPIEIRPSAIEPATQTAPEFAKFMTCFSELLQHVSAQN